MPPSTRGSCFVSLALFVFGCSAAPDTPAGPDAGIDAATPDAGPPRPITGGGVRGGPIAGAVHVFVVDAVTDAAIAGAEIRIGAEIATSIADGPTTFEGLTGPQTITVVLAGYRAVVWVGIAGAEVTIPLTPRPHMVPTANLSGQIADWTDIPVAPQHEKTGDVRVSASSDDDDPLSEITSALTGSICSDAAACTFSRGVPVGKATVVAAVLDRDTRGTSSLNDDITTVTRWATSGPLDVVEGMPQTGVTLTALTAAALQEVTVTLAAPPSGLPSVSTMLFAELLDDEAIRIPWTFANGTTDTVPRPSAFGASTYRLMVLATTSPSSSRRSVTFARNLSGTTLVTPAHISTPILTATRVTGAWSPIPTATLYEASWADTIGERVRITIFDPSITSVDAPAYLGLPADGYLGFRASASVVAFDPADFRVRSLHTQAEAFSTNLVSLP